MCPTTDPCPPGASGADAWQEGQERLGEGAVWHAPGRVQAERWDMARTGLGLAASVAG